MFHKISRHSRKLWRFRAFQWVLMGFNALQGDSGVFQKVSEDLRGISEAVYGVTGAIRVIPGM